MWPRRATSPTVSTRDDEATRGHRPNHRPDPLGLRRCGLGISDRFGDELDSKPLDREVLDDFARRDDGLGVVVDLGCGPGQVATYLAAQGVPVVGVDLSQAWSSSADMENHLDTAGFEVVWSRERVPYPDVEADTERAYLLARRPA